MLRRLLHSPEFKRLAAIQGDNTFIARRRSVFSKWAATQNVWSFCSSLENSSWKGTDVGIFYSSVEAPEKFALHWILSWR